MILQLSGPAVASVLEVIAAYHEEQLRGLARSMSVFGFGLFTPGRSTRSSLTTSSTAISAPRPSFGGSAGPAAPSGNVPAPERSLIYERRAMSPTGGR